MQQGIDRQRFSHGEDRFCAKLTEENVRAIRALAGTMLQKDIAALFNTARNNVCNIINRKTWKHIP